MKHNLLPIVAILSIACCTGWLRAGEPEGVAQTLFDGKTLNGWHVTGCEAVVDEGTILLKEGNGLVRTDHRYGDFVLELEWKALREEKYDSGIYFRCELPPEGKPWPRRFQANLLQGKEGNVGGIQAAVSEGLVKPGEWNRFRLSVVGSKATMAINGEQAWQADGIDAPSGYIALQAEVPGGGQFRFRNITLTEVGYRSLFNGKDLAGWEGAGGDAAQCWKVEDGQIVGIEQRGPWLRSKQQHGDFNLRLDYKVKAGGNSGVYVRVPESGNHHGKGAGVEIQILDDHAEKYAKLKDYQFTGSVYAVAPSTQHVGREAGEWNQLEINCLGPAYRITHNGVVIVDADLETFPLLEERLLNGFLGFQNHGGGVWFKNVRIGAAMP